MKSDIELKELNQEVVVTDLARGGSGVAKESSGRVLFIPFTAPGDLVRVQIVDEDRRYAQAELLEIVELSALRVTPPCPVFGSCGGCQWQHLPYSLQWETKVKGVLQALKRVGLNVGPQKVETESGIDLEQLPAQQVFGYRNRIQLRGQGNEIGFYRRGSQDLVAIERCEIAREEINQSLSSIRQEGSNKSKPYKVEVEVLSDGKLQVIWNAKHAAGGFRQVHDEQNEKLRKWISAQIGKCDVVFDLFGGMGNLSQPLIQQANEIHCVDLSVPQTPPEWQPSHFHFHRAPVAQWLAKDFAKNIAKNLAKNLKEESVKLKNDSEKWVILDPPREGLGADFQEIAAGIDRLHVNHLIAVGCDPDAWAKDLARWQKMGWKLEKGMVLDLFPQTPHVESVAVLRRDAQR